MIVKIGFLEVALELGENRTSRGDLVKTIVFKTHKFACLENRLTPQHQVISKGSKLQNYRFRLVLYLYHQINLYGF